MPFFKKSLAGPGYIVLNIIRVINIITLFTVAAASFAMLVKTFNISKFFFFDGVSHLITGLLSIALLVTELGLFRRYISHSWPLLSPTSGFVTLGTLMIILGVCVLGNLNKTATSAKNLGHSAWSLVIAAGILISIMGFVNIFASYAFRNKALDITARQVRMHGSTAEQKVWDVSPSMSVRSKRTKSFRLNRRTMSESLPRYKSDVEPAYQPSATPARNISNPLPTGKSDGFPEEPPVINGVQRPDLAAHPAFQGRSF